MTRPTTEFLKLLQRRIASSAVTPSAIRNMGAKGTAEKLRSVLYDRADLWKLASCRDRKDFVRALDSATESVNAALPAAIRSWGMARKVLKIYVRDAAYNAFLRRHYGLRRAERFMEIPLDQHAAEWIKDKHTGAPLPRWRTVKRLSREDSELYQAAARRIGAEMGIRPVHLDVWAWRHIGAGKTIKGRKRGP